MGVMLAICLLGVAGVFGNLVPSTVRPVTSGGTIVRKDRILEINGRLHPKDDSYNSFLREGDIIKKSFSTFSSRVQKWPKINDSVIIPYIMSELYEPSDRQIILNAFDDLQNSTCIRFVERTSERDFISIQPALGCYTSVGHTGGMQLVSLAFECLRTQRGKGVVLHELMHTVGFWHEHSRADREDYIKIAWEEIRPGYEQNFCRFETSNMVVKYDLGSILHYSRFAFSKAGSPTITPKIPSPDVEIGQRVKLSTSDILRINKFYSCPQYKPSASDDEKYTNYFPPVIYSCSKEHLKSPVLSVRSINSSMASFQKSTINSNSLQTFNSTEDPSHETMHHWASTHTNSKQAPLLDSMLNLSLTPTLSSETMSAFTLTRKEPPTYKIAAETFSALILTSKDPPTHTAATETFSPLTLNSKEAPTHKIDTEIFSPVTLPRKNPNTHITATETLSPLTLTSKETPTRKVAAETFSLLTLTSKKTLAHVTANKTFPPLTITSKEAPTHKVATETFSPLTLTSKKTPTYTSSERLSPLLKITKWGTISEYDGVKPHMSTLYPNLPSHPRVSVTHTSHIKALTTAMQETLHKYTQRALTSIENGLSSMMGTRTSMQTGPLTEVMSLSSVLLNKTSDNGITAKSTYTTKSLSRAKSTSTPSYTRLNDQKTSNAQSSNINTGQHGVLEQTDLDYLFPYSGEYEGEIDAIYDSGYTYQDPEDLRIVSKRSLSEPFPGSKTINNQDIGMTMQPIEEFHNSNKVHEKSSSRKTLVYHTRGLNLQPLPAMQRRKHSTNKMASLMGDSVDSPFLYRVLKTTLRNVGPRTQIFNPHKISFVRNVKRGNLRKLFSLQNEAHPVRSSSLDTKVIGSTVETSQHQQVCGFEQGLCGWTQSMDDDFNWSLVWGSRSPYEYQTQMDKPGGAHISLKNGSVEPIPGQKALLISPLLQVPECISFWYGSFHSTIGTLHVYIEPQNAPSKRSLLWVNGGHEHLGWTEAYIELEPLHLHRHFKVIMEGVAGPAAESNIVIDNLYVGRCR